MWKHSLTTTNNDNGKGLHRGVHGFKKKKYTSCLTNTLALNQKKERTFHRHSTKEI